MYFALVRKGCFGAIFTIFKVSFGSSCLKQPNEHDTMRAKMDFHVISYKKQENFNFCLEIHVCYIGAEGLFQSDFYNNQSVSESLVLSIRSD